MTRDAKHELEQPAGGFGIVGEPLRAFDGVPATVPQTLAGTLAKHAFIGSRRY